MLLSYYGDVPTRRTELPEGRSLRPGRRPTRRFLLGCCVENPRVRMVGHVGAQLGFAHRLLPVPRGGSGQSLARGGAQPPPVAVLQIAIDDELVLLFRHEIEPTECSGRRACCVRHGPLEGVVCDLLPAVLPDGVVGASRELLVVRDRLGVAVVLDV